MTIRKGQEWGSLVAPGQGTRTVGSDAELRELVVEHRRAGRPLPVVGLLGGDMMRTIGGTGDASRLAGTEPIPHVPIDIVEVVAGDRRSWFVAHLVVHQPWRSGSWWRGRVVAAMNAQFRGTWDVTPRGHPNDGRVDVVAADAALGIQQRWMARRRLPLGTHVPHPQISVAQHREVTLDLGREQPLWLDGVPWGTASTVRLTVEPDALVVCV